jgi:protein-export membrane protein SecD
MRKSSIWAIMLTCFFIGASVYALYPSIELYGKSTDEQRKIIGEDPELRKKIINLGLDLQGGMRLVLEVQRNKDNQNDDYLLDRAYTKIESRINGIGLTEPNVQKQGRDRLIVELPGLTDERIAEEVLGSTSELTFHIVRPYEDLAKAIEIIDRVLRTEFLANKSAVAQKNDSLQDEATENGDSLALNSDDEPEDDWAEEIEEEIEEEETISKFSDYLRQSQGGDIAVLEKDYRTVKEILQRQDVIDALRKGGLASSRFLWGNKPVGENKAVATRSLYFVKGKAEGVDGKNIISAREEMSNDPMKAAAPVVSFEFNRKGAQQFSDVTAKNVGERMAIVLDDYVHSAPNINERISMGRGQISGSFTMEEARALAVVLQTGALPAPMELVDKRVIGPSLGYDSIVKASWALLIGFVLISAFMFYRYKLSGGVAVVGVVLNVLFVLGIMAGLSATLTLPGIAGIILLIGMALDANVLIFERIREELHLGKAPITAIETGYARAFRAIFDANITTIFVALILYNIGSGPVRGFALTMMIGILVSLYTALTFTKTVFRVATASGKVKKLSI